MAVEKVNPSPGVHLLCPLCAPGLSHLFILQWVKAKKAPEGCSLSRASAVVFPVCGGAVFHLNSPLLSVLQLKNDPPLLFLLSDLFVFFFFFFFPSFRSQLAEVKVRILEAKQTLEDCISAQEFSQAAELKNSITDLENRRNQILQDIAESNQVADKEVRTEKVLSYTETSPLHLNVQFLLSSSSIHGPLLLRQPPVYASSDLLPLVSWRFPKQTGGMGACFCHWREKCQP